MTAHLLRRHLRAHARELVLLGAVVAALALLAGVLPRATDHLLTTNLRHQIRDLPAAERDLSAAAFGAPVPGPGDTGASTLSDPKVAAVWGALDGAINGLRVDMPDALRSVLGPPSFVTTLPGGPAAPEDARISAPDARLLPSFDPRLAEHIRITEGAMPGPVQNAQPGPGSVQIVLSEATSRRLRWPVGANWTMATAGAPPISIRLSGTYRPIDPDDPIWRHVGIALEPSVVQQGQADPVVTAIGWVDPASYPQLVPLAANSFVRAWYPLDVDAVDAHDASDLSAQFREAGRIGVTVPGPETLPDYRGAPRVSTLTSIGFETQTVEAIRIADRSGTSALALVALLVSGPAGVALAVLVLAAGVVVRRDTPRLALMASRGATERQLRALRALEGLACGLPAAAIGATGARFVVPGSSVLAWVLPAVVGLAPVVLLAAAPLPTGQEARHDLLARRGLGAVELVVLLAAATSVLLLRRRGLVDGGDVRIDPLLACTPLLLALAAAIVARRLQSLTLRWLSHPSALRRGVSGLVGTARSLRAPAVGTAAVVAVVTSVGIALFAGTSLATLKQGVADEARRTVGADLRIDGATAGDASVERVAGLPGVDAVASVRSDDGVPVYVDGRPVFVQVLFVDVAALRRVQSGTDGSVRLPAALDHGDRLAAVVSAPAAEKLAGSLEIDDVQTDIAATVPPAAGALTSRQDWILVDRDAAERAGIQPGTPQRLLVGTDRPDDVKSEVRSLGGHTRTTTPAAVVENLEQTPMISGVQVAALGSVGALAVLTGLAVLLTLARGATERRRQIKLLTTLGLPVRRAGRILGWEVLPSALVSIVVGTGLGLGLPAIVLDRVDLAAFTGSATAPDTNQPVWLVPIVAGGVLLLVVVAVATSAFLARRADLTDGLQMRED